MPRLRFQFDKLVVWSYHIRQVHLSASLKTSQKFYLLKWSSFLKFREDIFWVELVLFILSPSVCNASPFSFFSCNAIILLSTQQSWIYSIAEDSIYLFLCKSALNSVIWYESSFLHFIDFKSEKRKREKKHLESC